MLFILGCFIHLFIIKSAPFSIDTRECAEYSSRIRNNTLGVLEDPLSPFSIDREEARQQNSTTSFPNCYYGSSTENPDDFTFIMGELNEWADSIMYFRNALHECAKVLFWDDNDMARLHFNGSQNARETLSVFSMSLGIPISKFSEPPEKKPHMDMPFQQDNAFVKSEIGKSSEFSEHQFISRPSVITRIPKI